MGMNDFACDDPCTFRQKTGFSFPREQKVVDFYLQIVQLLLLDGLNCDCLESKGDE